MQLFLRSSRIPKTLQRLQRLGRCIHKSFGRQVVDDQVEEDELESRATSCAADCGRDSAQWRALRDEITSRSSASHRGAPRSPGCDQRSCDLAKAAETVTLRVSPGPQGVTVKLGAEAC